MTNFSEKQFKFNAPHHSWLRQHGLKVYFFILAIGVLLLPGRSEFVESAFPIFDWIPACEALLRISLFPAKTGGWIIFSILLYPLLHGSMKSRIYDGEISRIQAACVAFAVILVVFALGAFLTVDSYSLDMRSLGGRLIRRLSSSNVAFLMLAPMISVSYSFAVFLLLAILPPSLHRIFSVKE